MPRFYGTEDERDLNRGQAPPENVEGQPHTGLPSVGYLEPHTGLLSVGHLEPHTGLPSVGHLEGKLHEDRIDRPVPAPVEAFKQFVSHGFSIVNQFEQRLQIQRFILSERIDLRPAP